MSSSKGNSVAGNKHAGIRPEPSKPAFLVLLTILLISAAIPSCRENDSWGGVFTQHDVEGTFVLRKLSTGETIVWNENRAAERFMPASTFKIPNTLIGLQTGAVGSIDEVFVWDSVERTYDAWNRDMSLKEAFRLSAVWVYQELARRTGREAMEAMLEKCEYGNMLTGTDIDRFWLEGDIAISALEQTAFLRKLWMKSLPFDTANQELVRQIMLLESAEDKRLYAKTGWAARIENQIGWYTGVVECRDETWFFAMNIDIKKPEDLDARISVSREILRAEGIYPYTR